MEWSPSLRSCPPLTLLQAISVLPWSLLLLLFLLIPSLNRSVPHPIARPAKGSAGFSDPTLSCKVLLVD